MPDEDKNAPEVESNETETVVAPTEIKTEVKIGDAFETTKPEPKMVPEAVLIEYKKESKAVRKELDALKKSIEEGTTKTVVNQSLKDIADKHGVDAEFLGDFAQAVEKEAEAKAEEKFNAKLRPIEEKELAEKRDKIFNEHFDKTLAELPEYSKLVNKDVIKALAFDPKNANKTFAQIFQDSYGHLVVGKKTLESTTPRGGKEDTSIDFTKADKDQTYFAEIMADPELKAKYNDHLISKNRF